MAMEIGRGRIVQFRARDAKGLGVWYLVDHCEALKEGVLGTLVVNHDGSLAVRVHATREVELGTYFPESVAIDQHFAELGAALLLAGFEVVGPLTDAERETRPR